MMRGIEISFVNPKNFDEGARARGTLGLTRSPSDQIYHVQIKDSAIWQCHETDNLLYHSQTVYEQPYIFPQSWYKMLQGLRSDGSNCPFEGLGVGE